MEIRQSLALKPGDVVVIRVEDSEARLFSQAEGIRRAQELVGEYVPPGQSLSDELIAERRAEAARE